MAKSGTRRDEITVILSPEPPELNPEAARVLLRILLKAYEKQFGHEYSPARLAAVDRRKHMTGPIGRLACHSHPLGLQVDD